MTRPHFERLRDILEAVDAVFAMTAGMDFAAYSADFRTRKAGERCLEIVSEASRHLSPEAKTSFPDVPWPNIAGIGNILRHEYQRVADEVIWRTVTRSLPQLRPVIVELIARAERRTE